MEGFSPPKYSQMEMKSHFKKIENVLKLHNNQHLLSMNPSKSLLQMLNANLSEK